MYVLNTRCGRVAKRSQKKHILINDLMFFIFPPFIHSYWMMASAVDGAVPVGWQCEKLFEIEKNECM